MSIQTTRRSCPLPLTAAALIALIAGLGLNTVAHATAALPSDAKPLAQQAFVQNEGEETAEERRERLKRIAEERRKERDAREAADREEAIAIFTKYEAAYLAGKLDEVDTLYREVRAKQRYLGREKQNAIRHMNKMAPEYRPKWWKGTKKQEENSFKAQIWGKSFYANYVPSRELGLQAVYPKQEYNPKTGQLEIVDLIILVTWKPLMVDSPEPAGGKLAEMHGYKLGDLAEVIVWHELGHNHITETLSTKDNITLYERYSDLYSTMHEYFADMAAIYHGTPPARKLAIQFRLEELDYYTQDSSHCRGAHGIGAIIIADMLKNPDAWPSVRFPPAVPKQQVELNTIIYVYENLPPKWTVEEDIRLQGLAEEYVKKQGERTFKDKGKITLPSKLTYMLMIGEDREHQPKRDDWVRGKLEELISDGRADKLAAGKTYDPPKRDKSRRNTDFHSGVTIVNGEIVKDDDNRPPRIEVPWDF